MKQPIRSFSLGILTAVLILYLAYWNSSDTPAIKKVKPTESAMITALENKGYTVLTKKEMEEVKGKQTQPGTNNKQKNQETVSQVITIPSGATSKEISNKLEAANIIKDAQSFDQFMREGGSSRSIQVGSVTLNSQMTPQEIVEAITSK